MKLTVITLFISLLFISSCIPNMNKGEMEQTMKTGITMFADQEFQKAIGFIEVHKLRYGEYPNSLAEIKFLNTMDSLTLKDVQYTKLDSAYELNINYKFPLFNGKDDSNIKLHYPAEFWKGLGCIKSNAK